MIRSKTTDDGDRKITIHDQQTGNKLMILAKNGRLTISGSVPVSLSGDEAVQFAGLISKPFLAAD